MFCERLVTACRSFRRLCSHATAFCIRDLPTFLSDNLRYYKINFDNLCLRLRGYRNHVLRLAVSHQRGHTLRVNAIHMTVGVEN